MFRDIYSFPNIILNNSFPDTILNNSFPNAILNNSFPNAKFEENCELRGAYDYTSIFSRQMEAIELSLNCR